jgi:hypothetical protein
MAALRWIEEVKADRVPAFALRVSELGHELLLISSNLSVRASLARNRSLAVFVSKGLYVRIGEDGFAIRPTGIQVIILLQKVLIAAVAAYEAGSDDIKLSAVRMVTNLVDDVKDAAGAPAADASAGDPTVTRQLCLLAIRLGLLEVDERFMPLASDGAEPETGAKTPAGAK